MLIGKTARIIGKSARLQAGRKYLKKMKNGHLPLYCVGVLPVTCLKIFAK